MYKQLARYREFKKQIRIAKYVRCSSDEQKKNGYTISDQLDLVEDFCKEFELVGAGEYVDEGISATLEISKRKALAQLIEDAKAGKFDIVIFKCIDRFFRNVGEYYECQKQLKKAGVTWISIEEADLDPDDEDAAFKINIYLTMAEYEAKKTSKRIKFNNKNRIKNKQVVAGAQCFLFPWTVVGEKKNRHLVRNMEKADMLYDILDHFETHQSKREVTSYINTHHGYEMTMRSLTNLLTSTLLYGEYKGVPDYVEPYITKERFDNIQAILKRNARYGEINTNVFLFSGLMKCPDCGRKLVGNCNKPRREGAPSVFHYRCNKYRQQRTCSFSRALDERHIEKQLLDNLEEYVIKKEEAYEVEKLPQPKTDNTKRIEDLKKEMNRLNTMFRKGRIEEEEYDKEYFLLEAELKKIDVVEEEPTEHNLDAVKTIINSDYRTIYNALDKKHKKAFWRSFIQEFVVDENREIVPESIIFF